MHHHLVIQNQGRGFVGRIYVVLCVQILVTNMRHTGSVVIIRVGPGGLTAKEICRSLYMAQEPAVIKPFGREGETTCNMTKGRLTFWDRPVETLQVG